MRFQGNAPCEVHTLSAEIFLRRQRVVGSAPWLEIIKRRRPPERVCMTMMNLEPRRLAASLSPFVAIGAALAVALEHGASHRRRNVA